MSTITPLLTTFSSAITTNALLHLLTKASLTLTTIALYAVLTPDHFALWATTHSYIFLLLLWLDGGLRRSIPRYAPTFSAIRHRLIIPLITLQTFILLLGLPLLIYFLYAITRHPAIILLAIGIYLAEGIATILRSLYHAYFYHRFFNQVAAWCTLIDIIATSITISSIPSSMIVTCLLISRLLTTSLLITIAITQWHTQPVPHASTPVFNQAAERRAFIKHSFSMWITTLLTSISERNFLLPFILSVMGIPTTNLWKVAHDGALFFYRLIIKTIGSADIALLAHVQIYQQYDTHHEELMHESVQKLSTQITRLALPLLGIIMMLVPIGYYFYSNQFVFHAFLIMAIGYVLETIWIPYERVLEVKQNYRILSIIYLIYSIAIFFIFFIFYMTWIGLLLFLVGIHSVRLVIGILMRYSVYRTYGM